MRLVALVLGLALLLPAASARSAEWGLIVPATSTKQHVRARYGEPTRTLVQKIEGHDASQWVYEAAHAPVGMKKMTVDFGLLTPEGYRPELVRSFTLEPKPGIFTRTTIISGWGIPKTPPGETKIFFYEEGLLVSFDSEGWVAKIMTFTPPQPPRDGGPRPR